MSRCSARRDGYAVDADGLFDAGWIDWKRSGLHRHADHDRRLWIGDEHALVGPGDKLVERHQQVGPTTAQPVGGVGGRP